jgi:hypothetical protein
MTPTDIRKYKKKYNSFQQSLQRLNGKNWQYLLKSFLKNLDIEPENERGLDVLRGWICGLIERSFFHNISLTKLCNIQSRREIEAFRKQLKQTLLSINFGLVEERPEYIRNGKTYPSIMESIDSTIDRYLSLSVFGEDIASGVEAIILGGSLSYLPFNGVRDVSASNDHSDIDIICTVSDDFFNGSALLFLGEGEYSISHEQQSSFNERFRLFRGLFNENMADLISHRFVLPNKPYIISGHFMPTSAVRRLLGENTVAAIVDRHNRHEYLRDMRQNYLPLPCYARFNGARERLETKVECNEIGNGEFISCLPTYSVVNGSYFPGALLNIVSPAFLTVGDRTGMTTQLVENYSNALICATKHGDRDADLISFAKSHPRYYSIAPGRFTGGDTEYEFPRERLDEFFNRNIYITEHGIKRNFPDYYQKCIRASSGVPTSLCMTLRTLLKDETDDLVDLDNSINDFIDSIHSSNTRNSECKTSEWKKITCISLRRIRHLTVVGERGTADSELIVERMLSLEDVSRRSSFASLTAAMGKIFLCCQPKTTEGLVKKTGRVGLWYQVSASFND